jgi:hypothetical protein
LSAFGESMKQLDQTSLAAIQPELTSGENVLWMGQPNQRKILHKEDTFLIPFSLLWGGFAICWEAGVAGFWSSGPRSHEPWIFGMIWGIPFVLIGQYFIWGRFFYAAWKKKRVHYAVTNRRVIAVRNGPTRQMASAYIDVLPALIKEGMSKGIGTLRFSQPESPWSRSRSWGVWDAMNIGNTPTFVDIEDADVVYRLISDLRERARSKSQF